MSMHTKSPHWTVDATGIAVAVVITAVAVFAGLKPIVEQRLARADQQRRLAEQRENGERLESMAARMRMQLTRVEDAIEQSELRLEPVRQLNRRVAGLAELAGRCDLSLDEIQPGSVISGERYEIVPIHLAGSADYADCARFLHELAAEFPDVTLAAMELQSTPTTRGRAAGFRFTLSWHAAPTLPAAADAGGER